MDARTRNLTVGFVGGLAAAWLFPFFKPVLDEGARPLLKAALKQSMRAWERLVAAFGIAAETLEDLLAEVRAELDAEAQAAEREAELAQNAPPPVDAEAAARDGATPATSPAPTRPSTASERATN